LIHVAPPAAPALIASVRAAAARGGVQIVSLSTNRLDPTLKVVVRLDRPVAQLRRGALVPIVRTLSAKSSQLRWQFRAVGPSGATLRLASGYAHGGSAWIRDDLDGCDPSLVVVGRPAIGLFGSEPHCAGDPVSHPAAVGGARIGQAFPLALATRGLQLYALVNGTFYASPPQLGLPLAPVGQATLRRDGTLSLSLGGSLVVLRPA
jgi:hypothetical protein